MRVLIFIFLMCFSFAAAGQYYLTDEVAIWVTDTDHTAEFNIGLRTYRHSLNIEIITHSEHLRRIAAGFGSTYNIGDIALLSRYYRPKPSLAYVAEAVRIHWL